MAAQASQDTQSIPSTSIASNPKERTSQKIYHRDDSEPPIEEMKVSSESKYAVSYQQLQRHQ